MAFIAFVIRMKEKTELSARICYLLFPRLSSLVDFFIALEMSLD